MARGRRIAADPSRPLWTALSLTLLVLGWAAIAAVLQSRYLPSPAEVARLFLIELTTGDLLRNVAITLARVAAAALIAFLIGTAIGIFLGRHRDADRFFDSWLIFFLNVPALITIVLCYLWIGLDEAAAITAVALNKIPNVAVTLREGARALDPQYDEMANVFRFDRLKRLRHVLLPQLEPYLAAAARSGLALIWKIVLVVELIGRSSGVGFEIELNFQNFEIGKIFVYALAFMAVIQAIDLAVLQPWERRATRWRREA
ncbi:MAG TPA: ABC transporter permease subunit [Aestuariivirgaceae bacterium]|nr:ABC transporter permease subunit [Aestuariivirgaceae bacterium]